MTVTTEPASVLITISFLAASTDLTSPMARVAVIEGSDCGAWARRGAEVRPIPPSNNKNTIINFISLLPFFFLNTALVEFMAVKTVDFPVDTDVLRFNFGECSQ